MSFNSSHLFIRQRREAVELLGVETRNKYEILDQQGALLGFAAEQSQGLIGTVLRLMVKHWRPFEISIFDQQRQLVAKAIHPFRWFFQELQIHSPDGQLLGVVRQRFSLFRKSFDIDRSQGRLWLRVRSPFWSIWSFDFENESGRPTAKIQKKWGGLFKEMFLDADTFGLEILDPNVGPQDRLLLLASALFIDLQYFEDK